MFNNFFREVVSLGEEAHLNTSFKHFIYFVQVNFEIIFIEKKQRNKKITYHPIQFQEFQLIEKKELAPLQELIDRLTANSEPTSKMLQTTEH